MVKEETCKAATSLHAEKDNFHASLPPLHLASVHAAALLCPADTKAEQTKLSMFGDLLEK